MNISFRQLFTAYSESGIENYLEDLHRDWKHEVEDGLKEESETFPSRIKTKDTRHGRMEVFARGTAHVLQWSDPG